MIKILIIDKKHKRDMNCEFSTFSKEPEIHIRACDICGRYSPPQHRFSGLGHSIGSRSVIMRLVSCSRVWNVGPFNSKAIYTVEDVQGGDAIPDP